LDGIHDRPGVYHYAAKEHGLELRANLDLSVWAALTASFTEGSFLVGLSSILWREAWKYGERAFRYCQHDIGHALGTMRFAAAALGWKLRLLDRVDDAALSRLFGLDREIDYGDAEREHAELLAVVVRQEVTEKSAGHEARSLPQELVSRVANSRWFGTANLLSPEHGVDWPVIDQVAVATTNPGIAVVEEFSSLPRRRSFSECWFAPVGSLRKRSFWGAEAR
jgi:nitroreductase